MTLPALVRVCAVLLLGISAGVMGTAGAPLDSAQVRLAGLRLEVLAPLGPINTAFSLLVVVRDTDGAAVDDLSWRPTRARC